MSRWDKHTKSGSSNPDVVGEKVDCMEILQVGDNRQCLKLKCSKDDTTFWFDNRVGGRNAVQRKAEDGKTDEIHAKCPNCGCEWDGDVSHYYAAGFLMKPHPIMQFLAAVMGGGGPPMPGQTTGIEFLVFTCVKADDSVAALQQAITQVPDDTPKHVRESGIAVMSVSKKAYLEWDQQKSMKNFHDKFRENGDFGKDIMDAILSGRRSSGTNPSNGDPDAAQVMEAMKQEERK